jgi:Zn ribbon nucleic-acid-binding protein
MTWPTECPKCGEDDAFTHVYCDGWARASSLCFRTWNSTDHLHHRCVQCGYETLTPCKDAGKEPAK